MKRPIKKTGGIVALVALLVLPSPIWQIPAHAQPQEPVRTEQPEDIIARFFERLRGENIDEAYDLLVRGTIIAERTEDVDALKRSTQQALDAYGTLTGHEIVDQVRAGTSLVRFTCLSLNTELPLRWRFYFYRTPTGWKLVDLRIDDGLVELFDDLAGNEAEETGGRSPQP